MNAIQQFNGLNGRVVSRSEIEKILQTAKVENATDVVYRVSKILNENPDTQRFEVNITEFEIEPISQEFLAGVHFEEIEEEISGLNGLAAAVSPQQIYDMITKKMIEAMRSASGKDYKKTWHDKKVYTIPYNFVTKKPYTGTNHCIINMLYRNQPYENPYFLTFNQIQKLKGKIKKGAKSFPIIYYTNLYIVKKDGKTIFGAYKRSKVDEFLKKNNLDDEAVRKLPILKYYNVFNGSDIEGIDFKLDEAKIVSVQNEEDENPYGDSIVKHYETCPEIKHGGNKAYYSPSKDFVQMPEKEAFITSNDYFRTLFHELAHSTGHPKRLNRDFGGKFGSKKYAFEELIAEFTAVFVSAHAGIVWYSNKNHAEYLKNWSKVIGEMEKDSKFIVRAAAQAQRATDYILNFDKNGEPAFYKEIFKKEGKKKKSHSTENQKDKGGKSEKEKKKKEKKTQKADKETEKLFVKLLLPLYVERKNNPRKFTGHNDDSPENFRIEDTDFWAKFTDINTDLFKTKASKKLVKITEKGFEVLEKHTKKSEQTEENIIEKALEKEPKGTHLLLEDTAKKFKISKKETYAFYDKYRLSKSFEEYAVSERDLSTFEAFFGTGLNQRFFISVKEKGNWFYFKNNDFSREIIDYIEKRRKWNKYTKYGLSAPQLSLTTEDFKKMSVKELRAFTLQYYNENLKGKTAIIKKYLKEVVFTSQAGRKIAKGEAMYSAKAVAVQHLQELIENSTYNNWGDRKASDNKDVLGYLNFKSKLTIDGEKRHLRISLTMFKNRKTELKNIEVGNKKKLVKPTQASMTNSETIGFNQLSDRKITKKSENSKQKPKKSGLSAPQIPFFENLKDAKKYFLAWALKHLRGKKIYHKELEKWVIFNRKGIEHTLSSKISFEKMQLILQAEEMLKKSHLLNFEEEYKNRDNVKGVYRMQSVALLDNEEVKVILTLREGENGVIYYDHKLEIENIPTPPREGRAQSFCGSEDILDCKITKNSENSKQKPKKSGLGLPETFSEETKTPSKMVTNERNLAQKMASRPTEWEFFRIDNPQMANFLGKVEKKAKDSVVITLTGGQGSGKTRFAFQFINDLAQNYKVGHISNEEQPDSSLYYDKVQQYLNENALQNVEPYDVRSLEELNEVIQRNEIIVIDSFQKIKELDPKFEVDKDLRKKYNGKLFLVIFQQTSDGKMRGGSKSQFDGDIILFTEKFDDYRENYVYPDKNRYNSVPANELKYSIFQQKLLKEGETEVILEVLEDNLSFDVV